MYSINEEKVIVPKENDMFSEKEEDNIFPSSENSDIKVDNTEYQRVSMKNIDSKEISRQQYISTHLDRAEKRKSAKQFDEEIARAQQMLKTAPDDQDKDIAAQNIEDMIESKDKAVEQIEKDTLIIQQYNSEHSVTNDLAENIKTIGATVADKTNDIITKVSEQCELLGIKIPSFLLRRYNLASASHTCQRLWTPQA